MEKNKTNSVKRISEDQGFTATQGEEVAKRSCERDHSALREKDTFDPGIPERQKEDFNYTLHLKRSQGSSGNVFIQFGVIFSLNIMKVVKNKIKTMDEKGK